MKISTIKRSKFIYLIFIADLNIATACEELKSQWLAAEQERYENERIEQDTATRYSQGFETEQTLKFSTKMAEAAANKEEELRKKLDDCLSFNKN